MIGHTLSSFCELLCVKIHCVPALGSFSRYHFTLNFFGLFRSSEDAVMEVTRSGQEPRDGKAFVIRVPALKASHPHFHTLTFIAELQFVLHLVVFHNHNKWF